MSCFHPPSAHAFPRREQFDPGSLGEPCGSHGFEHLVGAPELFSGFEAALLTSKPFPVEEVSVCHLGEP